MNIFVLDQDPRKAAQYHTDKHVIKMILESAQLMAGAIHECGYNDDAPPRNLYRPTHLNHPCALWARQSISNWLWLRRLMINLNSEYVHRYNNGNHASFILAKQWPNPMLHDEGLTPFTQAMPEEYRNPDPVAAYRAYYLGAKVQGATWKVRGAPTWVTQTMEVIV